MREFPFEGIPLTRHITHEPNHAFLQIKQSFVIKFMNLSLHISNKYLLLYYSLHLDLIWIFIYRTCLYLKMLQGVPKLQM